MTATATTMDYRQYSADVARLAIYPYANQGVFGSLLYVIFGLTGESGEIAEKVAGLTASGIDEDERRELVKEAGDVLWYLERVCTELGTSLELMVSSAEVTVPAGDRTLAIAALRLMGAAGRVSEISKKALRDDNTGITEPVLEYRRELFLEALVTVTGTFCQLITLLGVTLGEVADVNIAKLNSRQQRGVLTGDGDNR